MIGQKIGQSELEAFARISGDYNPVHLDKQYASKSFFGNQIIYGIYQVFYAFEAYFSELPLCHGESQFCHVECNETSTPTTHAFAFLKLSADFKEAIMLGSDISVKIECKDEINLKLYSDDVLCSEIKAIFAPQDFQDGLQDFKLDSKNQDAAPQDFKQTLTPQVSKQTLTPQDSKLDFILQDSKSQDCLPDFYLNSEFATLFPHCFKNLSHYHIALLLETTKIVGMQVPGLNSIYAGFKLDFSAHVERSETSTPTINHAESSQLDTSLPLSMTKDSRHVKHCETSTPFNTTKSLLHCTHKKHKLLNCYHIDIHAPIKGRIKAYERPLRVENESLESLQKRFGAKLANNPFAKQRALVIGAGNGLGNACAKLLAIGGGELMVTHYKSPIDFDAKCVYLDMTWLDSARHVESPLCHVEPQGETSSPTINHAESSQLDTSHLLSMTGEFCHVEQGETSSTFKQEQTTIHKTLQALQEFNPTHLYYFATPKISSKNGKLSKEKLSQFLDYYVFYLDTLLSFISPKVLFTSSSSSFVADLPLDMKEYAMAKATAEVYFKYLQKIKNIKVYAPRFSRIKTNQTLSLLPQELPNPADALLPELLAIKE